MKGFPWDNVSFCLYFYISLAPDENPTGVQGFGTEHDNLVISWKVIKSYRAICFNPEAFTVVQRVP